jgi:hypothetical protein
MLLSLDLVRLIEVRRTELFIDPSRRLEYSQARRVRRELDDPLAVWYERCISASWPPAAMRVSFWPMGR